MRLKHIILMLCAGALLSACQHNRVDEPTARIDTKTEGLHATHTVAQLKALYTGGPTTITSDVVVVATMASDDTEGNLYRSAYIQDETGGIELKLSQGNLSTVYPQGAQVVLKARGLTLGKYGDQINLGYASTNPAYETAYYPEKLIPSALIMLTPGALQPRELTIATLSKSYAGQLIKINSVQFLSSELGQTYAAPENRTAQANVNRTLQDASGKTIIVRTSSYAKFAGAPLPSGSGSITALLTYFRDTPQLILLRQRDAELSGARF